jgi:uncharacterized Zn finger protein
MQALVALSGTRTFERGRVYADNGRVGTLTLAGASASAKVRGSSVYRARVWLDDGEPEFECSCPVGDAGRWCKHAVALALAATGTGVDREEGPAPVDLRGYLESLDRAALVDLVLGQAAEHELLDARLRLDAARATTGAVSIAVFRDAIDNVFVTSDYVDYRSMYDYASNIQEILATLRGLLDDGHAQAVMQLAEHAIDRAEDAIGYVDDSDGYFGGIAEELQALHLDACHQARPEPVALAAMLFDAERNGGDLEIFYGAAVTYADVLGEPGLAEYRRLAQSEWDTLPALSTDADDGRKWDHDRYRITHIMESLTEATGDVDAIVEVLARDLSSPYQFVRIAGTYRDAGRFDDALTWAEKGLEAFGTADHRLLEVAAEEYYRAGRASDAVELEWQAYESGPSAASYRLMCDQATRAGVWPDWRDRTLALLRRRVEERITAAGARGRSGRPNMVESSWWGRADASDLVTVFLDEGDVEQAWAEAVSGDCSTALWRDLARRRGDEHPLEVIPIWKREVERSIATKNNHGYQEAVEAMVTIERLMAAAGIAEEFAAYAASVRVAHKPKRNLMKLFNARGW